MALSKASPSSDETRGTPKKELDGKASFSEASKALKSIGAMSLERFVQPPARDREPIQLPQSSDYELRSLLTFQTESRHTLSTDGSSTMQAVSQLHDFCVRSFGSATDALKFEYSESDNSVSQGLSCIVTVTRPNGLSRSYCSPFGFQNKSEAKDKAAQVAIESGALTFIVHGDSATKNPRLLLAPLDSVVSNTSKFITPTEANNDTEVPHPDAVEIDEYCSKQRSNLTPYWLGYSEPNKDDAFGCILRIQLSKHVMRVYSVAGEFPTSALAKAAVARVAKRQHVFDFIKHGGGGHSNSSQSFSEQMHVDEIPSSKQTLQSFLDSLPSPIPDAPPGAKTASEINPLGVINNIIQSARGTGLISIFAWIPDTDVDSGRIGCLLRVQRPGDSRSYIVDTVFTKRPEAKSAVCLQAMSQGVGDYIREAIKELEERLTPMMRQESQHKHLPIILAEYDRLQKGALRLEFRQESYAFGCYADVELSADKFRRYGVPPEYRNKADARLAFARSAWNEGIFEFLHFRGHTPPRDYDPAHRLKYALQFHKGKKRLHSLSTLDDGPPSRNPPKRWANNNRSNHHSHHRSSNGSHLSRRPSHLRAPTPPSMVDHSRATWKTEYAARSRSMNVARDHEGFGFSKLRSDSLLERYSGSESQYNPSRKTKHEPLSPVTSTFSHASIPRDSSTPEEGELPSVKNNLMPDVALEIAQPPADVPRTIQIPGEELSATTLDGIGADSMQIDPVRPNTLNNVAQVTQLRVNATASTTLSLQPSVLPPASIPRSMPTIHNSAMVSKALSLPVLPPSNVPRTSVIPEPMGNVSSSNSIPSSSVFRLSSLPLTNGLAPIAPLASAAAISMPPSNVPRSIAEVAVALNAAVTPTNTARLDRTPGTPDVQGNDIEEIFPISRTRSETTAAGASKRNFMQELLEFCTMQKLPQPKLGHEKLNAEDGSDCYRVWIIHGKEQFEVHKVFKSIESGTNLIAKLLLKRLHKEASTK